MIDESLYKIRVIRFYYDAFYLIVINEVVWKVDTL